MLLHISPLSSRRHGRDMARTSSVFRYRIRNWREYNHAPINRERRTMWFDEQAITAWRHTEPAAGPGAPRLYSDLAIECALGLKMVFHLSRSQ
jgi:hypothetical protein